MTGVHADVVALPDAGLLRLELAARDIVLSAMSEGVLLVDPSGCIIYTNRAAHMILGRVRRNRVSVRDTRRDHRGDDPPLETPRDGRGGAA